TAVVAGTMPWHALGETLEAEYQAEVDEVQQPSWVVEAAAHEMGETSPPVFAVGGRGPVRYIAARTPDGDTQTALARLSAVPSSDDDAAAPGTVLWLSAEAVPPALV